MVIRLFDDPSPRVTSDDDLLVCPACQGHGEIVVPGSARQDYFGVWSADHDPCTACDQLGLVSSEDVIEVDCCTDEQGRPLTRWRGDRCGLEHEALCDDHLPVCFDGCGTVGAGDDDSWADIFLTGRSA